MAPEADHSEDRDVHMQGESEGEGDSEGEGEKRLHWVTSFTGVAVSSAIR